MDAILQEYYMDGGKKLSRLVDKVINNKFGGTSGKDMQSYYSVANWVMADIWKKKRYDASKGDFEGFLYNALVYAFIDENNKNNRFRRCNKKYVLNDNGDIVLDELGRPETIIIPDISLDAPIEGTDGMMYQDVISSDFNLDTVVESLSSVFKDEKIEKYFNSLTKIQKRILLMKMEGYSISEIKRILKLNNKQYEQNCNIIKSFEKISVLELHSSVIEEEEEQMQLQTLEKSKTDRISVNSIINKMDKYIIRFDHPLQRSSDQWAPAMKGNLISDILQGNPLPQLVFAEQVVNGIAVIWDIDGKQRSTNAHSFYNNGYRITKNIRRWNIEYQAPVLDENGNIMFDENGFPEYEKRTCDIRGKRFSDLPDELKDRFRDYNFDYVQYINCSSDDIAYHVIRYNEGRQMTASQKGITRIGEEYATIVKSISNMPFFKDMGGYKVSEFKNGTINRVIVESVMASKYLDEWRKKQEDLCEFLKNNASPSDFDNFEDMVARLEKVITDETANMFDSKDSFLWFGLFARFSNSNLDDSKFIDFMAEFTQSLHSKIIGDKSFDDINCKSTKDKNIVIAKIDHLEKLMNDYLCITKEEYVVEDVLEFVKETVSDDICPEDVELYEECLQDIILNVDNDTKLLDKQNFPSLLAIMAYAAIIEEDALLEEWIPCYFRYNNDYIRNQRKNFEAMKQSFDQYVTKRRNKEVV